jgi:L-ascorbate metabolism protein UlaG (beta-lactamase superfamily)
MKRNLHLFRRIKVNWGKNIMDIKNKSQARAPKTQPFGAEAFATSDKTIIRWLGNAGAFINSQGTCIMIDPLLEGFDLPLLIDMPIHPENVPHLDAVLVTHCDNDHFSTVTCKKLVPVCKEYHSTQYVSELMKEEELLGFGHDIGEAFEVGKIKATLTPADHAWQNEQKKHTRVFKFEDCCGFWLETPDGTIWAPGDSRLLTEHLQMPTPDAIIFDFSDDSWHIGLQGAVKLANAYPNTPLLLSHWGSVDAPNMDPFNADPADLNELVENPIYILAPGEAFSLCRLNETENN